jgi:DNA damage-inducible protein 1
MLKAHQACIDLEKDVLRIKGREVKFLSEHELPDKAKTDHAALEDEPPQPQASTSTPSAAAPPQGFPGSGQRLGGTSQHPTPQSRTPAAGTPSGSALLAARFPEKDIQSLMSMGVSREEAIRALEAGGGNLDMAASILF